jgi:hypothetical protein
MHLHIDFPGFDALKGDGVDMRDGHKVPNRRGD